nr:MAG TPA: hypothetical protein [Caudoviricetes sp.]
MSSACRPKLIFFRAGESATASPLIFSPYPPLSRQDSRKNNRLHIS